MTPKADASLRRLYDPEPAEESLVLAFAAALSVERTQVYAALLKSAARLVPQT